MIININAAKNKNDDFTLLDNAQLNNKNLNLGLNDNYNNNFNIDININNNFDKRIDDYINKIKKDINPAKTDIILSIMNQDPNIISYVIQCLKNCQELYHFLLNQNDYNKFVSNPQKYPISLSIANIMYIDFQNNSGLYNSSIKNLKDKYYIDVEDPKKIYEFILDNIHKENKIYNNQNIIQIPNNIDKREKIFSIYFDNVYVPENKTKISNLFFGVREVLINCGKCNKSNYEYYIFKYLEFQIEDLVKIALQNSPKLLELNRDGSFLKLIQNAQNKIITLEKCFEYYLNALKQEQSIYYCKKCSLKNDNYYYNNKIIILPEILCIVFKRDEGISFNVDFPEKLDISKYLEYFVEKKKI